MIQIALHSDSYIPIQNGEPRTTVIPNQNIIIERIRLIRPKLVAFLLALRESSVSPTSFHRAIALGPYLKSWSAARRKSTAPPTIFQAIVLAGGFECPSRTIKAPHPEIISERMMPVIAIVIKHTHPNFLYFMPISFRNVTYSSLSMCFLPYGTNMKTKNNIDPSQVAAAMRWKNRVYCHPNTNSPLAPLHSTPHRTYALILTNPFIPCKKRNTSFPPFPSRGVR